MSSIIIDKKEYLKAAGFVAGMNTEKGLHLWNGKTLSLYSIEEIKDEFLLVWA